MKIIRHTPTEIGVGSSSLLYESGTTPDTTRLLRLQKGAVWGFLEPRRLEENPVVTVLSGRVLAVAVRLGEIGNPGFTEREVVSGGIPQTIVFPGNSYIGLKILDTETEILYTSPRKIKGVADFLLFGAEIWEVGQPLQEGLLNEMDEAEESSGPESAA